MHNPITSAGRIAAALIISLLLGPCYMDAQPWTHGRLCVTADGRYLQHADGTPFFWLANTAWLLPEKLDRGQAAFFLENSARAGYNVALVQTVNDVPAVNAYGQPSHPAGWDFSGLDSLGTDSYWRHMDYIIDTAADHGIYIGMVCIWGGLVKAGKMDAAQARAYGRMLAGRYASRPNIIWIIGGDIRGDVQPEVWEALATTIREADPGHLMTFHPFGRTSSAYWWHNAEWLDLNLFQSGHRRYDQTRGDGDDTAQASVAEDNWRYVDDALTRTPAKPVIDGEPSYEDIPQGLHDTTQPRWTAADCRRYAYWSVFAGAAGHTYGHNSIMQMYREGDTPAYGATTTWQEALAAPGYNQMRHLKALMESVPFTTGVPDQALLLGDNGERYDRDIATRGDGYIMVYTYHNRSLTVDVSSLGGGEKRVRWFDPTDGTYEDAGTTSGAVLTIHHPGPDCDRVLVVTN